MTIQTKTRSAERFNADDMVNKPESFEDDLPDLIKYDRYCLVHKNPSEAMRSAWSTKALKYLRVYLAKGFTKLEIIQQLGITNGQYDKMEQELLETEGARYANMGAAHRFYLYILRQELSLRYLDRFIEENYSSKEIIPAIKAKSAILNETIVTGQQLGVVDKRAKELRVLGDINLALLPTGELEDMYRERLKIFGDVVGTNSRKLTGPHAKIVEQALSELEDEARIPSPIVDAEYEEVEDEEDNG